MGEVRGVRHPFICARCGTAFYPDNGKAEAGRMAGYGSRHEVVCRYCIALAIEHAELLLAIDREALDRRLRQLGRGL